MCDIDMESGDVDTTNKNSDNKSLTISGTNNRYLIKRANRVKNEVKKREIMNKYNIAPSFLNYDKQLEMLKEIYFKTNENDVMCEKSVIVQELDKKIKCYKQQDIIKKIYNEQQFVDTRIILQKLIDCNMLCFYCKCQTYILYENVREQTQWTVDRLDNSLGHNNNNFVISCLKCNIKRRKTNSEKFLFTRQLVLIKKNDRE